MTGKSLKDEVDIENVSIELKQWVKRKTRDDKERISNPPTGATTSLHERDKQNMIYESKEQNKKVLCTRGFLERNFGNKKNTLGWSYQVNE